MGELCNDVRRLWWGSENKDVPIPPANLRDGTVAVAMARRIPPVGVAC